MKGELLLLRALEPSDIDLLYVWENNVDEWKYSTTVEPFSRNLLEQYVLNSDHNIFTANQLRLMMVELKSGKAVGSVDLFEFSPIHQRAGVGIFVASKYRKMGFASEALSLVKKYAQEVLFLHQLYANIGAKNRESIALFQTSGYQQVGCKKEWLKTVDGWDDELIFQLVL